MAGGGVGKSGGRAATAPAPSTGLGRDAPGAGADGEVRARVTPGTGESPVESSSAGSAQRWRQRSGRVLTSRATSLALGVVAPPALTGTPPTTGPLLAAFPRVRQERSYSCGAASLRGILHSVGITEVTEERLRRLLGTNSKFGTRAEELVDALRAFGVKALPRNGMSTARLTAALDAGFPVIALYQDAEPGVPLPPGIDESHWSVVIGHGPEGVTVQDTFSGGRKTYALEEFEGLWFAEAWMRKRRFGIVVVGRTPAPEGGHGAPEDAGRSLTTAPR